MSDYIYKITQDGFKKKPVINREGNTLVIGYTNNNNDLVDYEPVEIDELDKWEGIYFSSKQSLINMLEVKKTQTVNRINSYIQQVKSL